MAVTILNHYFITATACSAFPRWGRRSRGCDGPSTATPPDTRFPRSRAPTLHLLVIVTASGHRPGIRPWPKRWDMVTDRLREDQLCQGVGTTSRKSRLLRLASFCGCECMWCNRVCRCTRVGVHRCPLLQDLSAHQIPHCWDSWES